MSKVKIGDLIRFNKAGSRKYGYGLVIRTEDKCFYYITCNKHGQLEYWLGKDRVSAANYIWHSNMLLTYSIKVIRHLELSCSFGLPSCGIPAIDNYLALLDDRYQFFIKHAPKELTNQFFENEDRNFHEKNSIMVAQWHQDYSTKGKRN